MTNDELKEKILTIVRGAMLEADELPFIETTDNIADALIAAGIGDVETVQKIAASATAMAVLEAATAEHRAEVAERALKDMAVDYWGVECFCHGCSESGCRNSCGEKYLVFDEGDAINCLVKNFLEQAEKELAEERKDD